MVFRNRVGHRFRCGAGLLQRLLGTAGNQIPDQHRHQSPLLQQVQDLSGLIQRIDDHVGHKTGHLAARHLARLGRRYRLRNCRQQLIAARFDRIEQVEPEPVGRTGVEVERLGGSVGAWGVQCC